MARSYLYQGKFDPALDEYARAFSLDPTHHRNFLIRGDLFYYQGFLDEAEKEYGKLMELKEPVGHYDGLKRMSALALFRGQFAAAQDFLREGIELAEMLGENRWLSWFILQSAALSARKGALDEAVEGCERALILAEESDMPPVHREALHLKGLALAMQGSAEEADRLAAGLAALIEKGMNKKEMRLYYHLKGLIALQRKDYQAAVGSVQKAVSLLPSPNSDQDSHAMFYDLLASAFFASGDSRAARDLYARISALTAGRLYAGDIYARSFYLVAKIDQDMKELEQAAENYERFIALWGGTDPAPPEIADARRQLSIIRNK